MSPSIRPADLSGELRSIARQLQGGAPSALQVRIAMGRTVVALEGGPRQTPEGEFAAPLGQVLATLNDWLVAKYRIDAAYRSFADRVKGPWRDALVKHWYEHAAEERDQAYDLAMKVVALGGDPILGNVDVPQVPANLGGFCLSLMDLELKAIGKAHDTIELAGTNGPLRVLAEGIMLRDSHHLDDLRRMCADFDMGMGMGMGMG